MERRRTGITEWIADTDAMRRLLLRYLPLDMQVLEIGCRSGKIAATLLDESCGETPERGPGAEIREAPAAYLKPSGSIDYMDIPMLPDSSTPNKRYSGVVSATALMNIPSANLFEFAMQLRALLEPGGVLVISSYAATAGGDQAEGDGEHPTGARPPEEIQLLFERIGFRFITGVESSDPSDPGRRWYALVLELGGDGVSRPVDEIETIISQDNKVTTYKLALLRALCDIARSDDRSVRWRSDGFVEVPLGLVVERWLFYYWPIIEGDGQDGAVRVPQMQGGESGKMLKFRRSMRELIARYEYLGGISALHRDFMSGSVPRDLLPYLRKAVSDIDIAIRTGPIVYAGSSIGDGVKYFSFERDQRVGRSYDSSQAVMDTLGKVLVRAGAWREMCLIGHWISESLILRWAELTNRLSRELVSVEEAVSLLLAQPDIGRDVRDARNAFKHIPDLRCTWTGRKLSSSFAVDHVIPFSVGRVNDLWNLVPAQSNVNSQKSDKLVTEKTLELCKDRIFASWEVLQEMAPKRFELEVKRALIRSPSYASGWEEAAFSGLKEKVETIAILRGMPRWDSPLTIIDTSDSP